MVVGRGENKIRRRVTNLKTRYTSFLGIVHNIDFVLQHITFLLGYHLVCETNRLAIVFGGAGWSRTTIPRSSVARPPVERLLLGRLGRTLTYNPTNGLGLKPSASDIPPLAYDWCTRQELNLQRGCPHGVSVHRRFRLTTGAMVAQAGLKPAMSH